MFYSNNEMSLKRFIKCSIIAVYLLSLNTYTLILFLRNLTNHGIKQGTTRLGGRSLGCFILLEN